MVDILLKLTFECELAGSGGAAERVAGVIESRFPFLSHSVWFLCNDCL